MQRIMPAAHWLLSITPATIALIGAWLNLTFVHSDSALSSILIIRMVACLIALQLVVWLASVLQLRLVCLKFRRKFPFWLRRLMAATIVVATLFLGGGISVLVSHELAGGPSLFSVGYRLVETISSAGRYMSLVQVGFVLGVFVMVGVVSLGCAGGFCWNGFGTAGLLQRLIGSGRMPPPLIDLVQNRGRSATLGPMLMLLPVALLSAYVLGATLLVPPTRVFHTPGPPAVLQPLCSPVVTRTLFDAFEASLGASSGPRRATPLLLFHRLWNSVYAPLDTSCGYTADATDSDARPRATGNTSLDGVSRTLHAVAVAVGTSSAPLPPIHLSLRDASGQPTTVENGACAPGVRRCVVFLRASLLSLPPGCGARSIDLHAGGEPSPSHGVASTARSSLNRTADEMEKAVGLVWTLLDPVLDGISEPDADGLYSFTDIALAAADGTALCAGRYALRFSLHSHPRPPALDGDDYEETTDSVPRDTTLLAASSFGVVVVPYDTSHGANLTVEMPLPGSSDLAAGTSTSGVIVYDNYQNLTHAVTTIVRTRNTTDIATQQLLDVSVDSRTYIRTPAHSLAYVQLPPAVVHVREPFNISVMLITELGLAVPAAPVQVLLLAPHDAAQPVRLADGGYGFTDANGLLTLTLTIESGVGGEATLLVGSPGTLHGDLRRRFGAQVDAILTVNELWTMQAGDIWTTSDSVVDLVRSGTLAELSRSATEYAVRRALTRQTREVEECVERAEYLRRQAFNSSLRRAEAERSDVRNQVESAGSSPTNLSVRTNALAAPPGADSSTLLCYERLDSTAETIVAAEEEESSELLELLANRASLESVLTAAGLGWLYTGSDWLLPQAQSSGRSVDRIVAQSARVRDGLLHAQNGGDDERVFFLMQLLLLIFGAGTPDPITLTIANRVVSAEMTAPFVGFGVVPTTSVNPTSLWETEPTTAEDTEGFCLRGHSLIFLPPQTIGREAFPLSAPIWQAPGFLQLNNIVDTPNTLAIELVNGSLAFQRDTHPRLCRHTWLASGQLVPGTCAMSAGASLTDGASGTEVSADGWPDGAAAFEAGALWLEGLGGNLTAFSELCGGGGDGGVDDTADSEERLDFSSGDPASGEDMRTLPTSARRRQGCVLGFALGLGSSTFAHLPQWLSSRPRIVVRDANGLPVAGRHCRIREVGDEALDVEALRLSYSCGPSDENGVIHITNLSIAGGSSRWLDLAVDIDGVPARLEHSSWYAAPQDAERNADGFVQPERVLHFLNNELLSFEQLPLLFLQGQHDSLYMLALLALPMFAMNRVDFHGQYTGRRWRLLGCLAMLIFAYIGSSLLQRLVGPAGVQQASGAAANLIAIGVNDVTSLRSVLEPAMPFALAISTFVLCVLISVIVTSLLLNAEYDSATRKHVGANLQVLFGGFSTRCFSRSGLSPTAGAGQRTTMAMDIVSMKPQAIEIYDVEVEVEQAAEETVAVAVLADVPTAAPPSAESAPAEVSLSMLPLHTPRGPDPSTPRCMARDNTSKSVKASNRRASIGDIFDSSLVDAAESDRHPARLTGSLWEMWEPMAYRRAREARRHVRLLLAPRRQLEHMIADRRARRCSVRLCHWISTTYHRLCCRCSPDGANAAQLLLVKRMHAPAFRRAVCDFLDNRGPFFYPQRLWMATVIGGWLQLLISSLLVNVVATAQAMVGQGRHMSEHLAATSALSIDTNAFERFSPIFRVLIVGLWEVLGSGARFLPTVLVVMNVALPLVQYSLLVFNWWHTFHLYRARLCKMRRGEYFFERTWYSQASCNRYIGFQVAGNTVNSMVICFGLGLCFGMPALVALLIVLDNANNRAALEGYVLRNTTPLVYFLVGLAITLALQMFCNKFVFYRRWHAGHMWLRFRYAYALYDYNLMFFNCTLGLGAILARIYSWFVFGVLTIGRADLCNLPAPSMIQLLDLPWNTYVALVMQDHQYNSPVASVFLQLLQHSLSTSRGERAKRKIRVNVQLVVQGLWVLRHETDRRTPAVRRRPAKNSIVSMVGKVVQASGQGHMEMAPAPKSRLAASALHTTRHGTRRKALLEDEVDCIRKELDVLLQPRHRLVIEATMRKQEKDFQHQQARRTALNRWALALMLLNNPSLRRFRRHSVRKVAAPEGSSQTASSRLARRRADASRRASKRMEALRASLDSTADYEEEEASEWV